MSVKLKAGTPSCIAGMHAMQTNIRLIKFVDNIPKPFWYRELSGKNMQVYLFPGYSDAISISLSDSEPIKSEHFELVKYTDGRNKDLRYLV